MLTRHVYLRVRQVIVRHTWVRQVTIRDLRVRQVRVSDETVLFLRAIVVGGSFFASPLYGVNHLNPKRKLDLSCTWRKTDAGPDKKKPSALCTQSYSVLKLELGHV